MSDYFPRKKIKDYTTLELINLLNNYENISYHKKSNLSLELLRRMNEITPLLPKEEDWGNPLTP